MISSSEKAVPHSTFSASKYDFFLVSISNNDCLTFSISTSIILVLLQEWSMLDGRIHGLLPGLQVIHMNLQVFPVFLQNQDGKIELVHSAISNHAGPLPPAADRLLFWPAHMLSFAC